MKSIRLNKSSEKKLNIFFAEVFMESDFQAKLADMYGIEIPSN